MRKAEVLAYYDGNQSSVARALHITRASVNGWPAIVPLEPARALEILTSKSKRKLRVDESLYPRLRLAREILSGQRHTA